MGSYAAVTIVVIVLLLFVGNLMTYTFQHKFIFKPLLLDSSYQFQFDHEFEELFLSTPKSGSLNCLYFPNTLKNSKGIILYYHGNADNLNRWGLVADDFLSRGYDFFVMDYRGFGKSTGPLSQSIMYKDALYCYEYLKNRFPNLPIVIYGRSLGSAMASHVAAQKHPSRLIIETPFYSMKDLFYTYYPFLPKLFVFRFPLPNHKNIEKLSCPVTIFHGDDDWIVPLRSAIKLKNHMKPTDEFILIEGASHNDCRTFDLYQKKLDEILS